MAPRKPQLPIIVEQGHANSRGHLTLTGVKQKRVPSASNLGKHVKKLRIFSPPQKISSQLPLNLVPRTANDVPEDLEDWEDDETEDDHIQPTAPALHEARDPVPETKPRVCDSNLICELAE